MSPYRKLLFMSLKLQGYMALILDGGWNTVNQGRQIFVNELMKVWKTLSTYPLGKITSRGRPEDVPKRRPRMVLHVKPMDVPCPTHVLRTSSTNILRTLPTSSGRWNMTSWGSLHVTLLGRPHIALYVMPREDPYLRLEDLSCRHYEDVSIWSNN